MVTDRLHHSKPPTILGRSLTFIGKASFAFAEDYGSARKLYYFAQAKSNPGTATIRQFRGVCLFLYIFSAQLLLQSLFA